MNISAEDHAQNYPSLSWQDYVAMKQSEGFWYAEEARDEEAV